MNYALVSGGIVRDMIVADASFIADHGAAVTTQRGYPAGSWMTPPAGVGIGWNYANGIYVSATSNQVVPSGTKLVLGVSAAGGAGTLSYQWKKDGTPIPGAASAGYQVGSAASGDAGSYTCTVTDGVNAATTSPAVVTVS